jgi:hypothetical protein
VLVEFIATNPAMAVIQGVSLGFSMVAQSFTGFAWGQPTWVNVLGLFGMKPLIEAWRDAVDAKPFPNQKNDNKFMLTTSRLLEVALESVPQSLVQCTALLLYPSQRSPLQLFSLLASFFTTGLTVALADRDLDMDKPRRRIDPPLFGYASTINPCKQIVASALFFTAYATAKTVSFSLLIALSSFHYALGLLCVEFFGLLGIRTNTKSWRVYRKGLDGVKFGLLAHLFWYICLLSAPFPFLRLPSLLTPRIYAGSLAYMLAVN